MKQEFRTIIALVISIGVVVGAYFGSYLPLRKSQMFIETHMNAPKVRSLQDFTAMFDKVLGFYSPVGQDEIVANYLGTVNGIIGQQSEEKIIRALVLQAEAYTRPIIESEKGLNLSQTMVSMGMVYKTAAGKLNDRAYFEKAVKVFENGLSYSPHRPIFLYNLFELYYAVGDKENTKKIGERILMDWPQEEKVRDIMKALKEEHGKK